MGGPALITATVPAGTGSAAITVTTPAPRHQRHGPDLHVDAFYAGHLVDQPDPRPVAGGTPVTIAGSGFIGAVAMHSASPCRLFIASTT